MYPLQTKAIHAPMNSISPDGSDWFASHAQDRPAYGHNALILLAPAFAWRLANTPLMSGGNAVLVTLCFPLLVLHLSGPPRTTTHSF